MVGLGRARQTKAGPDGGGDQRGEAHCLQEGCGMSLQRKRKGHTPKFKNRAGPTYVCSGPKKASQYESAFAH
eukprot:9651244-Alexandrium_andersonii.AAC.1